MGDGAVLRQWGNTSRRNVDQAFGSYNRTRSQQDKGHHELTPQVIRSDTQAGGTTHGFVLIIHDCCGTPDSLCSETRMTRLIRRNAEIQSKLLEEDFYEQQTCD
jgi:hypothetical protein